MKFLILLLYYNRPTLAKAAIESVLDQTYKDYEVVFIDDSEDNLPGEGLFYNYELDKDSRWKYIFTKDTTAAKIARGGSMFGEFCNQEMLKSQADVGLWLCDDDRLTPRYLEELNEFYEENPHINTSYCDVIIHDCLKDDWREKLKEPVDRSHFLNSNLNPHNMFNSKDASQGSWRLKCIKEGGVRMRAPWTVAVDAYFYNDLFAKYGAAFHNGIIGQVKNFSVVQLGVHGGYDRVD